MDIKYFAFLLLTLFCTSCATSSVVSSISIKTSFEEEEIDQKLKAGDSFDLKVRIIQGGGIESVNLDIVALGIFEVYDQIPGTKFKLDRTFMIDSTVVAGNAEIEISVKNKQGEQKVQSSSLEIH